MPIAFDPPTHAPHGTLPTRGARSSDDDPAALDLFTQLLLAAASVQDAGAAVESTSEPVRADIPDTDAPFLALPLGVPLSAGNVPPPTAPVMPIGRDKAVELRSADSAAGARRIAASPSDDVRGSVDVDAQARGVAVNAAQPLGAVDVRALATPALTTAPSRANDANAPLGMSAAETTRMAAPTRVSAASPSAATTLAALLAPAGLVIDKSDAAKPAAAETLVASQPAASASASPGAPVRIETISTPAFTPGWQDETVGKLAQVVLSRTERAEIKLHPAELGPVNVRIEMRADQASIQIVAASPETRSALEQSLPQLRDLLASQGITLGQATVHDGAHRDARGDAALASSRDPAAATPATARSDAVHLTVRRPDRLVDIFA